MKMVVDAEGSDCTPNELLIGMLETAFRSFEEELELTQDERSVTLRFKTDLGLACGGVCKVVGENFEIDLKITGPWTILPTLAHEMVHVAQLAQGRLRVQTDHILWGSKRWDRETVLAQRSSPDCELPWEIEAYRRMHEMMARFMMSSVDAVQLVQLAYEDSIRARFYDDHESTISLLGKLLR